MNYYDSIKNMFVEKYWGTPPRDLYAVNGYPCPKAPQQKLLYISRLITHPGRIMDMGCGNGLFLKLLMAASKHKLIPHGVDFLKPSIAQAKKTVLPAYKKNFTVGNVRDHIFKGRFDYILIFPDSVRDGDFKAYFEKCYAALKPEGMLIVYVERDCLARFKKRTRTLAFLKSRSLHWSTEMGLAGYIRN